MDRPRISPDPAGAAAPIVLETEGLQLEVVRAGAAVRRLVVAGPQGAGTNVVLGHADPATYAVEGGYLGATIGRFGNRLAGGRFELDGVVHEVVTNEGRNTLHGGLVGFDKHEWDVVGQDPDRVELALHSPDGDQGFPGAVDVTVTYSVAPGTVRLVLRGTTLCSRLVFFSTN